MVVPPNTTTPALATTMVYPPLNSDQIVSDMKTIYFISGYSIVAMTWTEAFAYFRDYCKEE